MRISDWSSDVCSSDLPPEVEVVTLAAQRLPVSAELPGRTAAFRVAEIRPQVDGIVRARLFTEGGVVTAGQPLSRIDPKPYGAALAAPRAELQQAEATDAATTARPPRTQDPVAAPHPHRAETP